RAQKGGMIDPILDQFDLLIALLAWRQDEAVSDCRTANLDSAQEGVTLELEQKVVRQRCGKIITGEFRALATLLGAVIDKIEHGDAFGGVFVIERIAEGVSRETQLQPWRAAALERLNGMG